MAEPLPQGHAERVTSRTRKQGRLTSHLCLLTPERGGHSTRVSPEQHSRLFLVQDHAAESCLHTHRGDVGQASLLRSHPAGHRPLGLVFLTSREQEPKARGPGSISFSPQRLAPAASLFPTSSSPISVPLFPMLTLMDSRLFWRRHSVIIENTKFVCLGPHRHRL